MEPTSTNRRPDDPLLDDPSSTLNDRAAGIDAALPGALSGSLYTKDSPTLGAAGLNNSRSTRGASRPASRWALALIILVALAAIAIFALRQHRMGDAPAGGPRDPAAPMGTPVDRRP